MSYILFIATFFGWMLWTILKEFEEYFGKNIHIKDKIKFAIADAIKNEESTIGFVLGVSITWFLVTNVL